MITVADLLDGPRGRRFLFELLLATTPDDSVATERVLGHLSQVGDLSTAVDKDTTRSLAAAFDDAPLAAPTPEQVVVALEETAESARWWQPPQPEDLALGAPGLREALHRLGTWAVAAPAVAVLFNQLPERWSTETEQWPHVEDRPDAAATLRTWADDLRHEHLDGTDEVLSGAWWTTVPSPTVTTTGAPFPDLGPLALWAVEDSFGPEDAVARPVSSGRAVRVRTIGSAEDWAELCRRWPLDVGRTTRRHDWLEATGRVGDWVVPDWSGVAERYDVVHLTVAGWFRTSGLAVAVDAERASVVAGWTPDTAAWLTDPAPDFGQPSVWARSQNVGPWSRSSD